MLSIQELREQRGAKAKFVDELVHKETWNVAVDGPVYDAAMAEIEDLDGRIKRMNAARELMASTALDERVHDSAARIARDQKSDGARIFAKWLAGGKEALDAADMAVIRNTLSTTTTTEGGFTVATEVAKSVLDALKAYGGMREVSTVLQTAQGNPMSFPTSDGTGETGELIAENVTATAADPTFGTKSLPVYKYSSKIIAVPFELLQDSSVDIEAFVRNRMVTRLGRITNTHHTVGTGTGQPNGLVTASTQGKLGIVGQTVTVIYDDLVDLEHSVDPAYRKLPGVGWMMHDTSLRVIRKLKDSQGRPIFVPGYETGAPGGAPDRLLDRPITINQDVAVMAANAKSILFGAFGEYYIRDVMDVTMFRFTDSAYAKLGQVGFLAWMRSGGNLIDVGGAVKHYANSAT
jgi:HK97 family phage major capsid protein